jgi:hypothetical protein
LAKFNQLTAKPGLFGMGESERGFVKMGWNKGYFLFLAQFNENGGVQLMAPSLPVDA